MRGGDIYRTGGLRDIMKGDFTHWTYGKRKDYSDVEVLQDWVQLDADWNEKVDLQVGGGPIFLEVWERDVESVEDGSIAGAAIGGPDSAPRSPGSFGSSSLRWVREVGGEPVTNIVISLGSAPNDGGASFKLPRLEITVGGSRWERVSSFSGSGPEDRVYVLKEDGGDAFVEFGDGKNGARPAAGSEVGASYRFGGGACS